MVDGDLNSTILTMSKKVLDKNTETSCTALKCFLRKSA